MPADASMPRVSLCVPLYRPDARYLARLLDSFAAQKYPNLQVVMVDDASPEVDVDALLAPLRERLDFTWTRNESNLGMVGNWNRAVACGSGELVMCVSQDDEL